MIEGIIIGVLLTVLIGVLICLPLWYTDWRLKLFEAKEDERLKRFFAEREAYLPRINENPLAKNTDLPQNVVQPAEQGTSETETAPPEPPFWTNRRKLETAKAQLEANRSPVDIPDLAAMSRMEAWRTTDAALKDLEPIDNIPIEAPDEIRHDGA